MRAPAALRTALLAGIALAVSGWFLADHGPRPDHAALPRAFVRALARPFVLPFLWKRVETAERRGDLDSRLAAFEAVVAWMPEWIDGQALFAWRLANSSADSGQARDDPARADRIAAAVAWLDARAASTVGSGRAELLEVAAFVLEVPGTAPAVRKLVAARLGADPLTEADARLTEALATAPNRSLAARRAFLVFGLLEAALARNDGAQARSLIDAGRARLRSLPQSSEPDDPVRAALHALQLLVSWLDEPPGPTREAALEQLARDRFLAPLVPSLR